jgi:predicted MFS family arabinose efflux permease
LYHVTQPAAARLAPAAPARAIIALTIAGAFASTVYLPLTGYLADTIGWRATLRVHAVTIAVVFLAAAAVTGAAGPAEHTARQRVTTALANASKSPAIRAWLAATLIGGAANDVMLIYQVPVMIAAGLPITTAATIAGIRGMAQLGGRPRSDPPFAGSAPKAQS